MEKKSYIVGVDIGSSQVIITVGCMREEGVVEVLGIETQPVGDSVRNGSIENVIRLGQAISRAKSELEHTLNIRIQEAYAGISGGAVYCAKYSDHVFIRNHTDGCIAPEDMRELDERMLKVATGNGDEILERIPQRYIIDDQQEVSDPVGRYGKKLSAEYLFLLCNSRQKDRVGHAFHNAGLKLLGLCIKPAVMPELLLSKEEREYGVAIVDIGAHLTDISIVRGGHLCYFASLPIGGASINQDLLAFVQTSKEEIEKVKRRYGSVVPSEIPENTTVAVKMPGRPNKVILHRNIAEITEARAKDIAKFVQTEIREAKFSSKIACGIVLTGGTALLNGIDELFAREMNSSVRLGDTLYGIDEESQQNIASYSQSAAVAILLYGAKSKPCSAVEIVRPATTVTPPPTTAKPTTTVKPTATATTHATPPVAPPATTTVAPLTTTTTVTPPPTTETPPPTPPTPPTSIDTRSKGMFGKISDWFDSIVKGNSDNYLE